ncbi:hypothetical protein TA3x_001744 [Tundrisphaera sp. TA3]|uniref:hypothetical protein n=1 Tax=Tundrisphaera sp. TA3 TaxID=3435775 RepID=UPI003EBE81A3
MASPIAPPARKESVALARLGLGGMSKPDQSRAILVATALIVAVVLLIWLPMWVVLAKKGARIDAGWVALGSRSAPVVVGQAGDFKRVGRPIGGDASGAIAYDNLLPSLRGVLARSRGPVVVSLSAAGVADAKRAFLLPPRPGALPSTEGGAAADAICTADALLAAFGEPDVAAKSKLLILDAGQVGSDRNLGVYANPFVDRLRAAMAKNPPPNTAILCSCAPGQMSWGSEADGRSAFGHFVALGLSGEAAARTGRRLSARSLAAYVRDEVARWVKENRGAIQTPELLAGPDVDFALRAIPLPRTVAAPAVAEGGDPKKDPAAALRASLGEQWARHDALRATRPYRLAPVEWREYQETLLRAERLFRAGDDPGAKKLLDSLPTLEAKLADAARMLAPSPARSLADAARGLALRPDEAGRRDLDASRAAIEDALAALTAAAEPEAPADPDKPPDAAKADADASKGTPAAADSGRAEKAVGAGRAGVESKARPSGKGAVAALASPEDSGRPAFVEAQVATWAGAFARRVGVATAFEGARGELLRAAIDARMIVESAVAADDRVLGWIAPLVERSDQARRQAQDRLFAVDPDAGRGAGGPPFAEAHRKLDEANDDARRALRLAEWAAEAHDLIERIAAEAPGFGEWAARAAARDDKDLDPAFVTLMDRAADLAETLRAAPSPLRDEKAPAADPDDPRPRDAEADYRSLKEGYEAWVARAERRFRDLAESDGAHPWREFDDALAVPAIPAAVRLRLLDQARSPRVASTLPGPGPHSTETSAPAEGSPDDPSFWALARNLARLDLILLELGGLDGSPLAAIREAESRARAVAAASAPHAARFAAFADLSAKLREARAASGGGPAMARVLPWSETAGGDDPTLPALRLLRAEGLAWRGRRLLEDFAPRHARVLFDDARRFANPPALGALAARADAMTSARLLVRADGGGAGPILLSDWEARPIKLRLSADGPVPAGDAAVFLPRDAAAPLDVRVSGQALPPGQGALAPVMGRDVAEPIACELRRTQAAFEAIEAQIRPGVFYRGRSFDADLATLVRIEPAAERVAISIEQTLRSVEYRGGKIKIADQFRRHEGQGFLHPGTTLRYRLVIRHRFDRPTPVVVRYGMKTPANPSGKSKSLTLQPGKADDTIEDEVVADDIPQGQTRTMTVTVEARDAPDKPIARRPIVFAQITPREYMAVTPSFDPIERRFDLVVRHLGSDPVTAPSRVSVRVLNAVWMPEWENQWILPGYQLNYFVTDIPPGIPQITYSVDVENVHAAITGFLATGDVLPVDPATGQPPVAPAFRPALPGQGAPPAGTAVPR